MLICCPPSQVKFYRSPTDEEPVRQWLQALKKKNQIIVGTELISLGHQSATGMPLGQQLGRTLHQIHCPLIRKNHTARVLFVI